MDAMKAFGTSAGPMTVDQKREFLDKKLHIACETGTDVPLVPIPFIAREDFPWLRQSVIDQINELVYFRCTGKGLSSLTKEKAFATRAKFMPEGE